MGKVELLLGTKSHFGAMRAALKSVRDQSPVRELVGVK